MACTVSSEGFQEDALHLEGTTVPEMAEVARNASLAFLRNANHWDKAGLARWIAQYYRPLTSHVTREPATIAAETRSPLRAPQRIQELTFQAHTSVMGTVRAMVQQADVSFSIAAVQEGWVQRCRDGNGRPGWVAVDRTGLKLADRALSILTVDYLVRPADWLSGLAICKTCGAVEFDPAAKARGICRRHRPRFVKIAS